MAASAPHPSPPTPCPPSHKPSPSPPQVDLLAACKRRGIPVLCCAGAGAKADPTRLRLVDVAEAAADPLARAVRHRWVGGTAAGKRAPCLPAWVCWGVERVGGRVVRKKCPMVHWLLSQPCVLVQPPPGPGQ